MTAFPVRRAYTVPLPYGGVLDFVARPLVMGILNVTPDSFADSPGAVDPGAAIEAALQMQADGADLIDIGGESTRPGATPVAAADEMARVLPVIRGLAGRIRIPLSIDTYKSEVARAAIDAGAVMINDVSGLRFDPALAHVAAGTRAALVLMHSRGSVTTMHGGAEYERVVDEVIRELRASIRAAEMAGVATDRIVVDPGIGFAKRPPHSYGVLAGIPTIACALERPVLVGPSRKSFLREATGGRPARERDWGTAAAVTAAVLAGAQIVRVHAVAEMVQVVRVAEEVRRHG